MNINEQLTLLGTQLAPLFNRMSETEFKEFMEVTNAFFTSLTSLNAEQAQKKVAVYFGSMKVMMNMNLAPIAIINSIRELMDMEV